MQRDLFQISRGARHDIVATASSNRQAHGEESHFQAHR